MATSAEKTSKASMVDYSFIRKISKDWKEGGLMRTVKFLDAQKDFKKALGIDSITIDLLKETSPAYFTQYVRNPKTKEQKQVDRQIFSPFTFACALRKRFVKN